MKKIALLLCCCAMFALAGADAPAPFRLWQGDAPGARGTSEFDIPTLTAYLPEGAKGPVPAVLICPGGGYGGLAGHEGADYARFLNRHGIAGFVLRYRLGSKGYRHPVMLQDAARAMRTIRSRAQEFNVDPARIGVMGSSAGGHLAATLLTKYDAGKPASEDPVERVSSRPDFGILCYAVVTMGPGTHRGSRNNLLGANPSAELIDALSAEKNVTADTPPCFIWHTADDGGVPVSNSINFATALSNHKVPFALHVYGTGRHGLGLGDRYPYDNALPWTRELVLWLKERKILP
ncbi:alpha/beta hydrolase [Victivallis vadensis]|jgi:alpha/beta hydrolase|uniref:Acetyl esterase/lipase n=1 Tax=Victivallis vadensis TaxID=172901 RepID=A0A2U1ADG4_9BACT|nr:alpha/beta hydrolase [Victivallis vadensis]PVY34458.1 acetyl esterase/lipase [Victivallis vadensis]HJH04352.1 alpha/beta hydrolase [Victivallis vadensis]